MEWNKNTMVKIKNGERQSNRQASQREREKQMVYKYREKHG